LLPEAGFAYPRRIKTKPNAASKGEFPVQEVVTLYNELRLRETQ
jgi:hypothetical protein